MVAVKNIDEMLLMIGQNYIMHDSTRESIIILVNLQVLYPEYLANAEDAFDGNGLDFLV